MSTTGDRSRWRRVQEIFSAALELSAERRASFLDAACAGEPTLRAEVEQLLEADDVAGGIFDNLAGGYAALAAEALELTEEPAASSWAGKRVGAYQVVREIGRGGMGAVYLAERDDLNKQVALKVVRGALAEPELVRRFLVERRVLARLEHPGIARLLDAGTTADGTPWFALELVDGVPITAYCTERRLSISQVLQLFVQVCDAVAYAHVNLVVHRDIKPSNVLVDASGRPRLLDFGIAKLLQASELEGELTHSGMRLLSPDYAAPEQVAGGPVTTATDVHALGLLLFELLTTQRPFPSEAGDPLSAVQAVLEREAPRPSVVARAAGGPERAVRALSGDLDAICLRALAKNPERRYASAQQIADDLRRFLNGMPVEAQLPTARYRAAKFLRRHAAAVAAISLLILALGGGLGASLWQAQRARRALAESDDFARLLVSLFEASDPSVTLGRDMPARALLEQGVKRVNELKDEPRVQGRMLEAIARAFTGLGDPLQARELAQRSVDERVAALGHDHPDVAASLATLAEALDDIGQEAAAADRFREALAIQRRTLPSADRRTTNTMLRLARLLALSGHHQEAQQLAEEALRVRRGARPQSPLDLAEAIESLALVRWYGPVDLPAADSLYRAALALRERTFGPADPRLEVTLVPLSQVLSQRGQHAEAERLARTALELRRRMYGPDHPAVYYQLSNVANVVNAAGRYAEAEQLRREVIDRYRAIYSGDHPVIAVALTGISSTFFYRRMFDSAGVYLRQSVDMVDRMYGPDHPSTALAHHNLGSLHFSAGRYAEAAVELKQAYEMRSRIHGPQSPGALRSGATYADALANLGERLKADSLLRVIEAAQRARQRTGDPDLARTLNRKAANLARMGREPEAIAALEESVSIWRATEELPTSPQRKFAVTMLLELYENAGRTEDAARLRAGEDAPVKALQ